MLWRWCLGVYGLGRRACCWASVVSAVCDVWFRRAGGACVGLWWVAVAVCWWVAWWIINNREKKDCAPRRWLATRRWGRSKNGVWILTGCGWRGCHPGGFAPTCWGGGHSGAPGVCGWSCADVAWKKWCSYRKTPENLVLNQSGGNIWGRPQSGVWHPDDERGRGAYLWEGCLR